MMTDFFKRLREGFSAAPLELRAYAMFSVLVTVIGVGIPFLGLARLEEAIVPYTGWTPALGYMFGLFFTFHLIYTKTRPCRSLPGVIAPLLLQIAFGLFDMRFRHVLNYPGNPMLVISPWRPVWTVVIPAIWIAILLSPRLRRFQKAG